MYVSTGERDIKINEINKQLSHHEMKMNSLQKYLKEVISNYTDIAKQNGENDQNIHKKIKDIYDKINEEDIKKKNNTKRKIEYIDKQIKDLDEVEKTFTKSDNNYNNTFMNEKQRLVSLKKTLTKTL